MDKYLVVAPLTLGAGVRLGLSKEQAAARSHALKAAGKGVYVTTAPVQFKAGEQIAVADELPKALAELLNPPKKAEKLPETDGAKVESTDETVPPPPGDSPAE